MDGATQSQGEVLRAFLAERDAPCPTCGYNLRGVQDPVCPECGGTVELALTGRAARGRWWGLVACFGALLLLAGIEAARAGRAAHTEAAATGWVMFSTTTQSARGQRVSIRPSQPMSIRTSSVTLQGSLQGQVLLGGTPPAPIDWSRVSWLTWTRVGWWGGLSLAAAAGLVGVLVLRRGGRAPGWTIVVFAGAAIALFVGAQAFLFVREIV